MEKSNSLKSIALAFATSVAAVTQADAQSSGKQTLPLDEYFSYQAKHGDAATHLKYTIFKPGKFEVTVNSSVHGPINMYLDPSAFIMPAWVDKDRDGRVDFDEDDAAINEVVFRPTMATMAVVHSGLNSYNENDPPTVKKAMEFMAQDARIVSERGEDGNSGLEGTTNDDHLIDFHGIELFRYKTDARGNEVRSRHGLRVIGAGEQMKPIMRGVKGYLAETLEP